MSFHPDDRYLEQTRVRWRYGLYMVAILAVSFLIQTAIGAAVAMHPTLLPGFDVPRMGSKISFVADWEPKPSLELCYQFTGESIRQTAWVCRPQRDGRLSCCREGNPSEAWAYYYSCSVVLNGGDIRDMYHDEQGHRIGMPWVTAHGLNNMNLNGGNGCSL